MELCPSARHSPSENDIYLSPMPSETHYVNYDAGTATAKRTRQEGYHHSSSLYVAPAQQQQMTDSVGSAVALKRNCAVAIFFIFFLLSIAISAFGLIKSLQENSRGESLLSEMSEIQTIIASQNESIQMLKLENARLIGAQELLNQSRKEFYEMKVVVTSLNHSVQNLNQLNARTNETIHAMNQSVQGASCYEKIVNGRLNKVCSCQDPPIPSPEMFRSTWYRASNGRFYKYFSTEANYKNARKNCVLFGAKLASAGMRNSGVMAEIKKLAGDTGVWIGLDEIEQEGHWVWADGVMSTRENTMWGSEEPNNYKGNDEDCGEIRLGLINDNVCDSLYGYVCEY